jgi:hypothetical protein
LQRAVAVVALASEFAASSFTGARTKYQSWSEERQKVLTPRLWSGNSGYRCKSGAEKKVAAEVKQQKGCSANFFGHVPAYRVREISLTFQKSACGKYLSSLTAR